MPETDFEIIVSSFSDIVGMGVSFLQYIHIGPVSFYDIVIAIMIVTIVGWLIEAAHDK